MGEAVTVQDGRSVLVRTGTIETDERATFSVQTLTGDLVLGDSALSYYSLDPNGSDRNITIPDPTATTLYKQIRILNSGGNRNLLVNDGGANTVRIKKGEQYLFSNNGVNWYARRE